MRALAVVLVLAAAAGCSDDASVFACTVDLQVLSSTGTATPTCGTFTRGDVNYTDQAMLNAQLCVLNALQQKKSFSLLYDAATAGGALDTGVRAGWVGNATPNGTLLLRTLAGQGSGDASVRGSVVSTRSCDKIDATPSCRPRVGVPCLTCTGTDPGAVACRG